VTRIGFVSWMSATLGTALVVGCTGDGNEAGCGSLGACGGDPTGTWTGVDWCQTAVETPPASGTSGSFCQDLVFSLPNPHKPLTLPDGGITSITLFNPSVPIVSTTVAFAADHTYQFASEGRGTVQSHFDRSCLVANGANPSCADLGSQLATAYSASTNVNGIVCCAAKTTPDDAGDCPSDSSQGCDCSYEVVRYPADTGVWRVVGNTLYLTSASNPQVQSYSVTLCQDSSRGSPTLQLTGFNGESLFGVDGLRSTTMVPFL
jgi:hypothetical protein